MIIEIPDDNSIVKWKYADNEDWQSAEISDLIKAYERPQGEWIIIDDTVCECPRCKHQQTFLLSPKESNVNFCEKCGADMRGEKK